MKIRSITCFVDPGWPLASAALKPVEKLAERARPAFEAAGFEVQSTRLATTPFPKLIGSGDTQSAVRLAQALNTASRSMGVDYLSLGPALVEVPESYAAIPEVLAVTEAVFLSGMLTVDGQLSLPAVRRCAQVICSLAAILPNGFANLYFAALANVSPGAPFFPAAYHASGEPIFALAMEAADLAVSAFEHAASLAQARQNLVQAVEQGAERLVQVAYVLERDCGVRFGGIDFTLAPFPQTDRSIGAALEVLGIESVGLSGTLAAAAFLTDTLDRARFPRAGFNGLMLPVLEDAVLAQRLGQGLLSVQDLLLYSAVCGTGLDTIPLPGDVSPEQLSAVLLDLAALALRLDKPLTARLMPIPGKRAGEPTEFDFPYFANSRILGLRAGPPGGLLAGDETLALSRRPDNKV